MLKKAKYTYGGINQDISKSKRDPRFYFDAQNIRIYSKDSTSTASATNEKGNELIFSLAAGQETIGHCALEDILVLFSTDNTTDKITTLNLETLDSFELFSGSLNFSKDNLIHTEGYVESSTIKKVYWVDGVNQLRHINIINLVGGVQTAYTQADATLFDIVPEVTFSAPHVSSIDYGGTHTSGMIQYAYNLISKGGSQSSISPISELYPLNKSKGGGAVNEVVGKILNVSIDVVDTKYDIIRLYAIKYTSYNVTPTISIIAEETIGGNSTFTFSDDGRVISTITADEFTFLGGTPYIPKSITTKFNRLILGNIKELYFDITSDEYDTRAYRFQNNSTTTVVKNKDAAYSTLILDSGVAKIVPSIGDPYLVPEDHDCITEYTSDRFYKYNSTTYGATGTNIEVEVVQKALADPRNVLKSDEIYRVGIEFYNSRGQTTPPKWIADLKVPKGNLNGSYNTLQVTLSNTATLTGLGVVGWRVLRVERTEQDKTILAQGIVNPLIFQTYSDTTDYPTLSIGRSEADNSNLKLTSPFMRNLTNLTELWDYFGGAVYINRTLHGQPISERRGPGKQDPKSEIRQGKDSSSRNHNSYEETRIFQFYSPELIFNTIVPSSNLSYSIVGGVKNTIRDCAEWAKQINVDTQFIDNELKRNDVLSLYNAANSSPLFSGPSEFNQNARIGGVGDGDRHNQYQYYRKYSFDDYATDNLNSILDEPVILGRGESNVVYNNEEDKYNVSNFLGTVLADRNDGDEDDEGIISVNSQGADSMLIVDGTQTYLENKLSSYIPSTDNTGLIDIVRSLINQYGGNTYEARSRNTYLRIGRYKDISTTVNVIDAAGDTFVSNFRFARIMQNTTTIIDPKYYVMTEIVDVPVESSIDCSNRDDASIGGWDSIFQPTFDEYHSYNKVYSQQPIFNSTTSTPFTFTITREFPHRLNATKVKVAGELVDSWTDILVNEEMYLDGKYGDITSLIRNNDSVYAFQEQGIAGIQIEPRVQTVATDGVTVELGTGTVLYTHVYLSTTSGSANPECVFNSPRAVYYLDVGNASINRIIGGQVEGLSDKHGYHSYLISNVDYKSLKNSNSVVGAFDQVSNDAYFTTPSFTVAFNEATDSFTSRYSFIPSRYYSTYYGLYMTNGNNSLYKHGDGEVGNFFGTVYPSYITFIFNPEPEADCVFNNLEFKSEVYNNGVDVAMDTINKIHCWNEYQDTTEKTLIVGSNIKRKYRDWNLFIPRNASNILQRMRGQWLYCKLTYNNTNDYNLILHDVLLSYDSIQKSH